MLQQKHTVGVAKYGEVRHRLFALPLCLFSYARLNPNEILALIIKLDSQTLGRILCRHIDIDQ